MHRAERIVRFNAVGLAGIGVHLAAFWLLVDVAHLHYVMAAAAAVAAAVVHNFIWHWRCTWNDRSKGRCAAAFVRFAGVNGTISLAGNLGVMTTLVSRTHIAPVAANSVAIAVCGLANFWIADIIVFRQP